MGYAKWHIIGEQHVHCVGAYCGVLCAIAAGLFYKFALIVEIAVGIKVDECAEVAVLQSVFVAVVIFYGKACTLWHVYNLWHSVEDLCRCGSGFKYCLRLAVVVSE